MSNILYGTIKINNWVKNINLEINNSAVVEITIEIMHSAWMKMTGGTSSFELRDNEIANG